MTEDHIPRRAFLIGGAAALAAIACGRGGGGEAAQSDGPVQFVSTNIEQVVGDRRLAFAIFEGPMPLRGREGSGTVILRDPDGERIGPVELRTFHTRRSSGGDAEPEGPADLVFVAEVPYAKAGFYETEANVRIDGRSITVSHRIGVAEARHSATLTPGREAIAVATPTSGDPRGVDPICTRRPVCDMHSLSLDEALEQGRPLLVSFATPALCTSRTCGPVIDFIEGARSRQGDGVEFVHVEIYKDLQGSDLVEAVREWGIDRAGEPFTFLIGADRVVRERLSGPVGQWEIEQALGRLKADHS